MMELQTENRIYRTEKLESDGTFDIQELDKDNRHLGYCHFEAESEAEAVKKLIEKMIEE